MKKLLLVGLTVLLATAMTACSGGGDGGGANPNPTYTITYDGNGNTGGSVPIDPAGYEQGQTVTVLGNPGNLVKTGYSLSGWNTQADGAGTTYTQAQTFTMGAANVILYAKWTANSTPTYTVTYDGNGNTGGSVPVDPAGYEQGQTVTVLGNPGNLVNTGYSFSGWNTRADGAGTTYTQAQTFTMGAANVILYAKWSTIWTGTKQLGVAGAYTDATGVAVDANGNVYVAGFTDGGLDGNTLTGTEDFFLTKYDSMGNKVFTRQLGVAGLYTEAMGVAVDAGGNVYVAGFTDGGLDGNTLTGTEDFFLTKYDSSGNKVFTRQLGVAGAYTEAFGVAVDASGNVYVAGYTYGGLDGNTLAGTTDFFLTKYDSSGSKAFTKQLGVAGAYTQAWSVAVDASGNAYVAGYTNGGLDGNTLTGSEDFFLTKYDSSGNKVRTKQFGVTGHFAEAFGVAVDASGNVYVAGYTDGGLDGNTLTGIEDLFLTKYDTLGNKVRTEQLGVAGSYADAMGVAVDASGKVYLAGYTGGGLDGNTVTGIDDFFLTEYDSLGNKVRTKQLGVAGAYTYAFGVAADASGNVYVTGYTNGGLDGNTLTGTEDLFLTKYDSAGNKQ